MKTANSFFPQILLFNIFQFLFLFTIEDKQNWIWTIMLILLLILLIRAEIKRYGAVTSSLCMWYVFWLLIISIGRMDLHLYEFNATWTNLLTYAIILVNYSFFFAYIVGYNITKGGKRENDSFYRSDTLFKIILSFQIISILSFALNVVSTGMIPLLGGDTDELKEAFSVGPFYKFVNICRVQYILIPFVLRFNPNKSKRRIIVFVAVIALICELLSGWRGYFFQAIFLFLTSYFLLFASKNKKQSKKLKKQMAMAGVLAFGVIGLVGAKRAQLQGGDLFLLLEFTFSMIYLYFAPSFLNLQTAMQTIIPKGYPLYTTEAFWSIFIPKSSMPGFESIEQNIGAFNVSTYLLQPWADGGIAGMMIVTAILGFISGYASRTARSSKIFPIVLMGTMNVVIFVMHNGFILRSSSCFIWMLIGLGLSCYSQKKNRYNEK